MDLFKFLDVWYKVKVSKYSEQIWCAKCINSAHPVHSHSLIRTVVDSERSFYSTFHFHRKTFWINLINLAYIFTLNTHHHENKPTCI